LDYLASATEASIQDAIYNYLIMRGHLVIRVNAGAMHIKDEGRKARFVRFVYYAALGVIQTTAGISDILGCTTQGRFYAVECKRVGEKPKPAQVSFLRLVSERGGLAIVASSIEDCQVAGL